MSTTHPVFVSLRPSMVAPGRRPYPMVGAAYRRAVVQHGGSCWIPTGLYLFYFFLDRTVGFGRGVSGCLSPYLPAHMAVKLRAKSKADRD